MLLEYTEAMTPRVGNKEVKTKELGTCLVVQQLRHCAPNAGGPGSIPSQGTGSHMPQLKIPSATAKTTEMQYSQILNRSIF